MPTTRKQKSKARKSRETDILSDFENLDIMPGSSHLEREESELSNSVRRPESPSYNALVNHEVNSLSGIMPETAIIREKLIQAVKSISYEES